MKIESVNIFIFVGPSGKQGLRGGEQATVSTLSYHNDQGAKASTLSLSPAFLPDAKATNFASVNESLLYRECPAYVCRQYLQKPCRYS